MTFKSAPPIPPVSLALTPSFPLISLLLHILLHTHTLTHTHTHTIHTPASPQKPVAFSPGPSKSGPYGLEPVSLRELDNNLAVAYVPNAVPIRLMQELQLEAQRITGHPQNLEERNLDASGMGATSIGMRFAEPAS